MTTVARVDDDAWVIECDCDGSAPWSLRVNPKTHFVPSVCPRCGSAILFIFYEPPPLR